MALLGPNSDVPSLQLMTLWLVSYRKYSME